MLFCNEDFAFQKNELHVQNWEEINFIQYTPNTGHVIYTEYFV